MTMLCHMLTLAADAASESPAITGDYPFKHVIFFIIRLGYVVLVAGIVLSLYRILRGPHQADKVLAGDVLAMQVVGLVILLTMALGRDYFIDAALVVALVGFASTVAFSQYIGARAAGEDLE